MEGWKSKPDLDGEDMPDFNDLHGKHMWKHLEKDPHVGSEEMGADDRLVEGIVEEVIRKEADRHGA